MRRLRRTIQRDQGGASAVEFALILIPLFLIVFGIIEFGMAYNRSQGAHAAAREGARVASIGRDAGDVGDAVIQALEITQINGEDVKGTIVRLPENTSWNFVGEADGTATVSSSGTPCDGSVTAERVEVTMEVEDPGEYSINLGVVPIDIPQSFKSKGVFRCEP